jgi:hypothetical protein
LGKKKFYIIIIIFICFFILFFCGGGGGCGGGGRVCTRLVGLQVIAEKMKIYYLHVEKIQ